MRFLSSKVSVHHLPPRPPSTPPSCANWCTLPSPPQERLGIDRLEFRLDDCDDIGDSASQVHGALHRDRKGHLPGKETFSKRLGRFLRDPSVWCAGFQVSAQCSVFSAQCSVLSAQCSAQCSVLSAQCSVLSAQCSVLSVLFPVFSAQCPVFSVQCSVLSVRCQLPPSDGRHRTVLGLAVVIVGAGGGCVFLALLRLAAGGGVFGTGRWIGCTSGR
jgi:hypothetical protein